MIKYPVKVETLSIKRGLCYDNKYSVVDSDGAYVAEDTWTKEDAETIANALNALQDIPSLNSQPDLDKFIKWCIKHHLNDWGRL